MYHRERVKDTRRQWSLEMLLEVEVVRTSV